jgi:hypothetical protein
MIGRLIGAVVLGLLLFVLASVSQALLVPTGEAGTLAWWILLVALAVTFFVAFRAPTIRKAWGHLFFLDGLLCLALAPASLFPRASTAELDYPREIITDAAVRYAIRMALAGYLPVIILFLALLLLALALLLLRPKWSKDA